MNDIGNHKHKTKQLDVWMVGDKYIEETICFGDNQEKGHPGCGRHFRQFQGGTEAELSGR